MPAAVSSVSVAATKIRECLSGATPAFVSSGVRHFAVSSAALKLWFFSALPVIGLAGSRQDDQLFLPLAEYITTGQWLGSYSQFTLMKGCGYPLFIAGACQLGIPLPVAEHGLYLLACWLLVRAVRPLLRNDLWALGFFALLAWQPMSYWVDPHGGNILRQNLYTPLTVIIFAGLTALHTRRTAPAIRRFSWALVLGISGGWFWLTREESIWIGPAAGLLVLSAVIFSWRFGQGWPSTSWPIGVAAVCAVLPIVAVCSLNAHHYGWFGTVEMRAPDFVDAYAALSRVRANNPVQRVPLPKEGRWRAYKVSPSFAQLEPLLDGDLGRSWVGPSYQFNGGMWIWAFRDAVMTHTKARTPHEAFTFYRRIADEVNAACDDGRLVDAGPPHHSLAPVWTRRHYEWAKQDFSGYLRFFLSWEGTNSRPPRSSGTTEQLRLFRDMTQWFLARGDQIPELATPRSHALRAWRIGALQDIGHWMRWLCVFVTACGFLAWLAEAGTAVWKRRAPHYLWWLASAALAGASAVFAISFAVHVSAWPDWRPLRFAEAYPLLILFAGASLALLGTTAFVWNQPSASGSG
jgi:hypothetical protein